jgi:hypothetical protein
MFRVQRVTTLSQTDQHTITNSPKTKPECLSHTHTQIANIRQHNVEVALRCQYAPPESPREHHTASILYRCVVGHGCPKTTIKLSIAGVVVLPTGIGRRTDIIRTLFFMSKRFRSISSGRKASLHRSRADYPLPACKWFRLIVPSPGD